MTLCHRPVETRDLAHLCTFPQSPEELFFLYPKAQFPLTPAQLQAAIDQRANSTVVVRAGEVVGFANFYRWETGGRCAIGNVMVAPAARGQGVGRYLIACMIEQAFSRYRAAEVAVSCFNRNVAGLLLYPTLGFQPYAIEARRGPQDEPVALIHLRLPRQD